jgi:transposase
MLRRAGHKVVEANRPDRRTRWLNAKSDILDAENAARAVLAGYATAVPKTADGSVEIIWHLKIAHNTAVKARASAMVTLKVIVVHAPERLPREVAGKTPVMLARHQTALRPEGLATSSDASRHTLRFLARRWQYLQEEAQELEGMIAQELEGMIEVLLRATAPQLVEPFGIGVDTTAEILIVVWDNFEQIRSEAALA